MSITAAFRHPRPFPFVVLDEVPENHDYIGGLTLEQAQNFWWNIESLSVVISGTFDAPPLVDLANTVTVSGGDSEATAIQLNAFLLNDGSSVRAPRDRIAVNSRIAVQFRILDTAESWDRETFFTVTIIKDPGDSEKFALAYSFMSKTVNDVDSGALISNPERSIHVISGDPEFYGQFSFGGFDFEWVGGAVAFLTGLEDGSWIPGGQDFDISVTPSFFSYE